MTQWGSYLRFATAILLLTVTALFLHDHSRAEQLAARRPLALFPHQIGSWTGQDVPIAPDILDILGPGDFLSRIYQEKDQNNVDLFIAYFPSQRTGDTIHSPKNCLPGAGWIPLGSATIQVPTGDGHSFPANRYIIAKGTSHELVLYWYQSHARRIASEYSARLYLMADAVRLNRTDGALVRIITPVAADEKPAAALSRAVAFARQILPQLNSYIPR